MLFVKVVDGVPVGRPIPFNKIKDANPNVSLPKDILSTDHIELLRQIGYEPVPLDSRDRVTANVNQIVELIEPELVDGVWRRRYRVRERTLREINKKLVTIRLVRNRLLQECDFVELPSVRAGKSEEWCQAWDTYRQQLRDITDAEDVMLIRFPNKPTL